MKPLLVLLLVFIICICIAEALYFKINFRLSAIVAMSVMLVFTGISHYTYTEGMSRMLPDFIPLKKELVYATGLLEIILAIGLIYKRTRGIAAFSLITFLILVLPANIHAATYQVNFADISIKGLGPDYLWFRIPLQLFFIAWIYYAVLFTRSAKM